MGENGAAPPAEGTAAPASSRTGTPWSLSQDEWQQTQQFIQAAAPVLQQLTQQPDLYDQYQQEAYSSSLSTRRVRSLRSDSVQRYIQQSVQQGVAAGVAAALGPYEV
jgi:hypothetical protein